MLAAVKAAGRLVVWPDDETLARLVPEPVTVSGSDKVLVFPRTVPGSADAPVVLHVLNQDYDGQNDVMRPQQKFTIRLRRDLFPAAKIHHSYAARATTAVDRTASPRGCGYTSRSTYRN